MRAFAQRLLVRDDIGDVRQCVVTDESVGIISPCELEEMVISLGAAEKGMIDGQAGLTDHMQLCTVCRLERVAIAIADAEEVVKGVTDRSQTCCSPPGTMAILALPGVPRRTKSMAP